MNIDWTDIDWDLSFAGHSRAVRVGLSLTVELAVLWACPGAGTDIAGRGNRLGQCHRVPDTGAGGNVGQLCLRTSARIAARPG